MWPFKEKYSALHEARLALKETAAHALEVLARADSAAVAKVYDKASFDECLGEFAFNWQVYLKTVGRALERWEMLILAGYTEAQFRKD